MERRTSSATFPPAATSVAAARRFVRRTLSDWDVEQVADDAMLATSELATNAVAYAGTSFEVTCTLEDGGVRIEVLDHHPTRHIAMPSLEATSGRGLPSIDRIAASWGVTYDGLTKGVWFRLPTSPATVAEPRPAPPPGPLVREDAPPVAEYGIRSRTDEGSLEGAVEAVRDMLAADGAAVLLADREGDLVLSASTGAVPKSPAGRLTITGLGPHARAGVPWVAADASDPVAAALAARSMAAAPLQVQGRLTGIVVAVSNAPDRFDETAGKRLGRIADEMALTLERARLGELERSWRGWLSFVAEASDLLAGTLDSERTMALVTQLVVPRLATWCAVYTVDDTGIARPAYVWHADETRVDGLRELLEATGTTPPLDVSGAWNGHTDAPAAVRAVAGPTATDQAYAFPLVARGRRMGALVIGRPTGDRFPQGAIDLAEELSRRAALAIDNARLYTAQTAMSSALQRSLLPPDIPDIPGLEVEVVYQPAGEGSEVGGDFYDVFTCGEAIGGGPVSRWRFAIGDVCGTGPQAAAVTGLARHALRILAAEDMPVPDVLARLNRLILAEGPRAKLLTLLHGEITPLPGRDGVRIDLVSAGHPPPLVLDPDGSVREGTDAQPLLGVFDDVEFTLETLELRRGQVLLCVTDGVTERRAGGRLLGDGDGLERLLAGCRGLSAGAVAARIQRAVRDFGPEPSNDDVALIVLRAS